MDRRRCAQTVCVYQPACQCNHTNPSREGPRVCRLTPAFSVGRPAGALRPGCPKGPYPLGLFPASPSALRTDSVRVSAGVPMQLFKNPSREGPRVCRLTPAFSVGHPAGALRPGGPVGPYSPGLSPAGPLALRMKGMRVSARSDLCLLTGQVDSAYGAAAAGGTIPPTGSSSPLVP